MQWRLLRGDIVIMGIMKTTKEANITSFELDIVAARAPSACTHIMAIQADNTGSRECR